MTNVLYFEGAGCDFYGEEQTNFSDVGNFRIRTSFLNNDGDQIYLEMMNGYVYDKKGKNVERFSLCIDFCYKVPKNKDEEIQYHEIYKRHKDHLKVRELNYTKEDMTKWINENLNCNFDTIEVLDYFYGYRVFGENGQYNLMENIDLNHERAAKRKETYHNIDMEYRKLLNEKYSKINLESMDNESITIRCYASDKALGRLPRIKRIAI